MIEGFVVVDVARASRLASLPQEQRCRNMRVRTVLQKGLPNDHKPLNTVESSNSTKAVASSQKAFGAATLR